ncbi:MAG: hypothetical protein JSR73_16725 [Proteobacteria bacterium]|nr:hypothetical protein [Pseudomonadota bacterium]
MPRPLTSRHIALIALLAGAALITALDSVYARYRYPYSGDSASYIDMADSLLREGRPSVTPWDVEPVDRDAIPQPLFPPGFSVLIAALTPVAGDVRRAALWPGRLAAALLPLLLIGLFRGALSDGVLAAVATLVVLSQGVRDWHFLAYSDVPALALGVVALGALARGLGLTAATATPRRWLLLAGFAAGVGFCCRNAALAVLAVSAAALIVARLRGLGPPDAGRDWVLGAAPPVAALLAYNLATFGQLQPYHMPASVRPWTSNLADYALAQFDDLGLPTAQFAPAAALALLGSAALLVGAALWRLRDRPARQLLLGLLAGYAGAGGLLLVVARSRYEWGNLIDNRNVLQYTFACALAVALAVDALAGPRLRRLAALGGLALVLATVIALVRDVRSARGYGEEAWLTLSRDQALMASVRALPPGTLIASNSALLFRLGVPRPVRELEVGGSAADFEAALAAFDRAVAGRRAAAFVLVCDEWTGRYPGCGVAPGTDIPAPGCQQIRNRPPLAYLCERPAGRG